MSTIDLVKAAQERKYLDFENLALEMLKKKVTENPIMQRKLSELDQAQNLDEAKIVTKTVKFQADKSSELSSEEKAYFKKNKIKVKFNKNGTADLTGSEKAIEDYLNDEEFGGGDDFDDDY